MMANSKKPTPDIAEVYADLIRTARALADYKDEVVLAGGLVPLCYRKLFGADEQASAEKRDKDLAYLYDLAIVSQDEWGSLQERMADLEGQSPFPEAWWKDARKIIAKTFAHEASQGPIGIARIYSSIGETVSEEGVFQVMTGFFKQVFSI